MTPISPWLRISFRRAHLASGLILFAYVLTHFCNHMAGLVSLDAMTYGLSLNSRIWSNPPCSTAPWRCISALPSGRSTAADRCGCRETNCCNVIAHQFQPLRTGHDLEENGVGHKRYFKKL